MPYRRLPNTDQARLRALKAAMKMGNETPPFKLACSQVTLQKVRYFLPIFEKTLAEQMSAYSFQVKKNKEYIALMKKAKLYISHFVQVLNFTIARGELPASARKYYGISENSNQIPVLNTEKSIIDLGDKIMKGEQERIANRGNPMTNPTMAVVRVHYEKFLEAYRYQKSLKETTNRALNKISELRFEADSVILNLWNEVEDSYSELSEEMKRENSMKYGVVYVFRSHEKKKMTSKAKLATNHLDETLGEDQTEESEKKLLHSPYLFIN